MCIRVLTLALWAVAAPSPADARRPGGGTRERGVASNESCLACHSEILDVKPARGAVANLHRVHLRSTKTAYGGVQRSCVSCHEMIAPAGDAAKREGSFVAAGVRHPNVLLAPAAVWKKQIVRPGARAGIDGVEALRPAEPHPYKPALRRLVCVDCHDSSSDVKTLYGVSERARAP